MVVNTNLVEKLNKLFEYFSNIDDIHIENEDDNYSYQSLEYQENLISFKECIDLLSEQKL